MQCASVRAFVAEWVTFSISEELALHSNIKNKCDQSARNPKQTAEPCWDASFLKMQQCKTVSESQRCLFILLSQCKSPHSFSSHLTKDFYNGTHKSKRRKTFVFCLSLLALTLSQKQERSWFFQTSWTVHWDTAAAVRRFGKMRCVNTTYDKKSRTSLWMHD